MSAPLRGDKHLRNFVDALREVLDLDPLYCKPVRLSTEPFYRIYAERLEDGRVGERQR